MNQKKLFSKPYNYKEAFLFTALFPITGFILQFLLNKPVKIPPSPFNIYIILGFVLFLIFSHLILRKNYFFQWISTVPVSISSIIYTSVLVLIMALVPQNESKSAIFSELFGLNDIAHSWQLAFTCFITAYNLGLAILRRINKFSWRNVFFVLNHLGLWIIIVSAVLGSGDLKKLDMCVYENSNPEWRATDNEQIYELTIAIELLDFQIDEYNPEIALVENSTNKVLVDDKNKSVIVEKGAKIEFENYIVEIKEFYSEAVRFEGKYVVFPNKGSVPAAQIIVYDKTGKNIADGWICGGSFMNSPELLKISEDFSVGMLQPAPKKYSSKVKLYAQDGIVLETLIEVNKPVDFKGWTIYQLSYDEEQGKWSELSILQLVRDPWIPFIYAGIIMVLCGSVYLFWIGKKTKE